MIRILLCGTKRSTLHLENPEKDDKTFIGKVIPVKIVGHDNSNDCGSKLTQHNNVGCVMRGRKEMLWEDIGRFVSQADVWITLYVPPIGVAGDNIRSSVTNSLKL